MDENALLYDVESFLETIPEESRAMLWANNMKGGKFVSGKLHLKHNKLLIKKVRDFLDRHCEHYRPEV